MHAEIIAIFVATQSKGGGGLRKSGTSSISSSSSATTWPHKTRTSTCIRCVIKFDIKTRRILCNILLYRLIIARKAFFIAKIYRRIYIIVQLCQHARRAHTPGGAAATAHRDEYTVIKSMVGCAIIVNPSPNADTTQILQQQP
jgi:hypothetical protein